MNKLYAVLVAAIGLLALPAHAQYTTQNSEMGQPQASPQDEMHKDGMQKDNTTKAKKKSAKKAKKSDEMMKKDDTMKKGDDMMKKDDAAKQNDMMKKE